MPPSTAADEKEAKAIPVPVCAAAPVGGRQCRRRNTHGSCSIACDNQLLAQGRQADKRSVRPRVDNFQSLADVSRFATRFPILVSFKFGTRGPHRTARI